jgi:hypothetical protein
MITIFEVPRTQTYRLCIPPTYRILSELRTAYANPYHVPKRIANCVTMVIPNGTPVDTKAISSAIQNQLKLKPQIRCRQMQNQFYLYEIGLCLTASKDPEFIDCKAEFVGCSIHQKVYFL